MQWENVQKLLFRKYEGDHVNYLKIVSCQATLAESRIGLIPWPLLRVIRGHTMSNAFLSITFDRIEIKQWGLVPMCFFFFVESHRPICNMNYLGRHVTSRDLDMWSNFDIIFFRLTWICFYVSRREKHDWVRIISLTFLVQKLFKKMSKISILTFLDLCTLTR